MATSSEYLNNAELVLASYIHDTIEKLPKGYNTGIGEHGVGLSGGAEAEAGDCAGGAEAPEGPNFR